MVVDNLITFRGQYAAVQNSKYKKIGLRETRRLQVFQKDNCKIRISTSIPFFSGYHQAREKFNRYNSCQAKGENLTAMVIVVNRKTIEI